MNLVPLSRIAPGAGLAPEERAAVDRALAAHRGVAGALLPILHAIQDELGFVPPAAQPVIARALNITRADVHGVVSFYHDFRGAPPGRHVVKLCRAEACQAVGADALAAAFTARHGVGFGETSRDRHLTLDAVYCLGNCALGPSAMVDGRLVGRCTVDAIDARLTARETAS
jgi:formate dehydrogenase subunit gamma